MRSLARRPPAARDVAVVTTRDDEAVDNARAHAFAARCAAPGVRVREYEFPARDSVRHDMIDPEQVGERTEVSYPALLRFLRGETSPR
jgi:hypothetical protein